MSDTSVTVESFIERNKASHERAHIEEAGQIRGVWAAIDALKAQGFDVDHENQSHTYLSLDISVTDLPRVFKAIGRVEVAYKDVAYKDGEVSQDTIRVNVRSVRYPGVRFSYHKPLPPMDRSPRKCRIVTTSRVETSTQLVCDRA